MTTIIGASDSLKCKLMAGTFKDVVLRLYMSFPGASVLGYVDLAKKMVQHFSASQHRKVSTTTLLNLRQAQPESLRLYLARFNEETIKISHSNQDMFVRAF